MIWLLVACRGAPETADWTERAAGPLWVSDLTEDLPVPDALADVAGLDELSAWGWSGQPDGRARAGSLGVGNGRVFGLVGLDDPVNTMSNLLGPGYQQDGGFFGDASALLLADDVAQRWDAQALARPRGLLIVRTLARAETLSLGTVDVAVPGYDIIARHLTVTSAGASGAELSIRLTLATSDDEQIADGDRLIQERDGRTLRVSCPGTGAVAGEAGLEIPLPSLGVGEQTSVLCLFEFFEGEQGLTPSLDFGEAVLSSRSETEEWLGGAARLDAPDPRVEDLLEGLLLTARAQTAESGVVSPLSRYTKGWLRDAEGPVRLYLAAGLHEDAAAILDATYAAMLSLGEIRNSFPLDVDIDDLEAPDDPAAFWAEVPFMDGRGAAEAPSYPILLHALLAARTGVSPDADRLAFLQACLDRQEVSDEGYLPWSGDETFRYPFSVADGRGLPEEIGWSAWSGMLWLAAADALDGLGGAPDAVTRAAVQRAMDEDFWLGDLWTPLLPFDGSAPYPAPYEDVSLGAWWVGTAGDRQRENLDTTLDVLLRDDGTVFSEDPPSGVNIGYTGMIPGLLLSALSAAHRDEEALAFDALDLVATPSGHFEELHQGDHEVLQLTHAEDGLGADVSARYRPWEGGDVGAALLRYLVGAAPALGEGTPALHLAPHLPPSWSRAVWEDLRLGDDRYGLRMEGYDEGLVVVVERDVAQKWMLHLVLHLDHAVGEVWIDGERVAEDAGALVTLDPLPWTTRRCEITLVYAD